MSSSPVYQDPKTMRRAPGAEHPVRVRTVALNPRRLVGVPQDLVDLLARTAAGRAIGLTLYMQPAEQVQANNPGARGTQERIR